MEAHETLDIPTLQKSWSNFEASQELLYGSYDAHDLITNDEQNNKYFKYFHHQPQNYEDGEPIVELVNENTFDKYQGGANNWSSLLAKAKYSIHSPTCWLYTIDEVNSNYSENELSTNAKANNPKMFSNVPELIHKASYQIQQVQSKENWPNTWTMNPILVEEGTLSHPTTFLYNTIQPS